MKRYEHIDEALCREMDKLDKKYAGNVDMTMQDLEMIRLLRSAMVKGQTYEAMMEERGWEDKDASGTSYRRGRDAMGRYTSRDMMPGYSGHMPEWMPPYYGGRY
jgi:hypothetical protein